jgi:hypothetical protein
MSERGSDLRVLAFRKAVPNAWIKGIPYCDSAKRTVASVIFHGRQRCEISAVAIAASRKSERWIPRCPGP